MEQLEKEKLILQLNPRDFEGKILPQSRLIKWLQSCDAFWIHDGDPKKPHAQLTSGLCSNGFFDLTRVLCYPNINEILARQIIGLLQSEGIRRVDWVVGSAYAGITLSYQVARILRVCHGFVEKDPNDPEGKKMVWHRLTIPAGAKVLQVDEVITTLGTILEQRRAIEEGNKETVNFLSFVGSILHRPPQLPVDYGAIRVVAPIEVEVWAKKPKDCPLCQVGSKRLRPKTHWQELMVGR